MHFRFYIITLFTLSLAYCTTSKNITTTKLTDLSPSGKFSQVDVSECPSKCNQFIGDPNWAQKIIIYTGNDLESPLVTQATIGKADKPKWVKRRLDSPACKTSSDEECFIWCLEPSIGLNREIQFTTVIDTTIIKEFQMQTFYGRVEEKATECLEVCPKFQTSYFFYQLSSALSVKGFLAESEIQDHSSKAIEIALLSFQMQAGLKHGRITYETIKKLGINEY